MFGLVDDMLSAIGLDVCLSFLQMLIIRGTYVASALIVRITYCWNYGRYAKLAADRIGQRLLVGVLIIQEDKRRTKANSERLNDESNLLI